MDDYSDMREAEREAAEDKYWEAQWLISEYHDHLKWACDQLSDVTGGEITGDKRVLRIHHSKELGGE